MYLQSNDSISYSNSDKSDDDSVEWQDPIAFLNISDDENAQFISVDDFHGSVGTKRKKQRKSTIFPSTVEASNDEVL